MFYKLIKYIIALLLTIILFCIIPKESNPIPNIYLSVLFSLLFLYFIDNCGVTEYFNVVSNNKDLSNNNLNNNEPVFEDDPVFEEPVFEEPIFEEPSVDKASIELKKIIQNRINELNNIKPSDEIPGIIKPSDPMLNNIKPSDEILNNIKPSDEIPGIIKPSDPMLNNIKPSDEILNNIKQLDTVPDKDVSNNNCNNNSNNLITTDYIHNSIKNLILPYLESITYNNNTINFKPLIINIINIIKEKNDPTYIINKVEETTNLLKDSNSELYNLLKHITLILNSIIYQKQLILNSNNISIPGITNSKEHSDNILDVSDNLYIKKHFSPLFENILLVILSYNKLPDKLQSKIKYIINLINNNEHNNNVFSKIKEVNNDVLYVLNDKQIISDKVAKTYLLMAKNILNVIIKNYKLIILEELLDLKSDILQLNKDMENIMKTHLGKILKLNISLEYNSLEESNIKTYLLVEFNSAMENVHINNDSNNAQISEMLKQLANKLEVGTNECDCETKVNQAVEKYLKNGKYIDDNGIIKNIMNSDMIYNQLDVSMLQSLGSYDDSFSNKWDKGYTYLNTSKWSVPKVQIGNPPNMNNVQSSLTPGYPINLLEFDNSRKVLGPDNINLQYIKEKLN